MVYYAYIRGNTRESIQAQSDRITQYCNDYSIKISHIFCEILPAHTPFKERKEFVKLIDELLEKKEESTVLVDRLSVIARDAHMIHEFKRNYDIGVVFSNGISFNDMLRRCDNNDLSLYVSDWAKSMADKRAGKFNEIQYKLYSVSHRGITFKSDCDKGLTVPLSVLGSGKSFYPETYYDESEIKELME